jgi:RNA polymerase sigma-70 factor (ECF subfamily)
MQEDLKIFFGKIMEDNKHRILRICSVYAGDPEDRKDLFQDVALNIWKALPSFRKEATIDTWLYRICLNVCMQHALKLKRTKHNTIDIDGIKISDDSNIYNNMENAERIKQLYSCIAQLNEADKLLITLFLEDLPYKIMSDITGFTENHIAVKLNRVKKKLFNCLNV